MEPRVTPVVRARTDSFIWSIFTWVDRWNDSWWRHQMETFSALLAICAGNSPVPGEFPTQRPVTRSFDVYFDLRPDKRLSKHSWGWWFETLSHSLWRHRNVATDHCRVVSSTPKCASLSSRTFWSRMSNTSMYIDIGNGLLPRAEIVRAIISTSVISVETFSRKP